MTKPFKPLLASAVDLETLCFPCFVSPKLDGVRALVRNGVVYSRSNKPIPNPRVQELFGHLEGFDGELIVGDATARDVFNKTTSYVMSKTDKSGSTELHYQCFDYLGRTLEYTSMPFRDRVDILDRLFVNMSTPDKQYVHKVPQFLVYSLSEVEYFEERFVSLGYEGIMLRSPDAPYKQGRSTVKEQILLKLKRFADDEAVVIGMEELQHNDNEAVCNALGHTSRSSHADGKTAGNTLGALIVKHPVFGVFNIGTGFTALQRQDLWDGACHIELTHTLVKFKYLPHGMKDKPRHPVFLGFRDPTDL